MKLQADYHIKMTDNKFSDNQLPAIILSVNIV